VPDFYEDTKIATAQFSLRIPRNFARLENGGVIPSARGFAYWAGSATMPPQPHAKAAPAEVDLMDLAQPGASFLVYDKRYNGPLADPGGVILGAATPTLSSIASSNDAIVIAGLPAGYVLSKGDYIGWLHGDGRRSLHRAKEGATANGSGITPEFEVRPLIDLGTATGLPITLVKPTIRAIITQEQYGAGRAVVTPGASFDWQEKFR
jgi:hypothetical protein